MQGVSFSLGVLSAIRACVRPHTDVKMRCAVILWFLSYFFILSASTFMKNNAKVAFHCLHVAVYLYRTLFILLFGARLTEGLKIKRQYHWWPYTFILAYTAFQMGWISTIISKSSDERVLRIATDLFFVISISIVDALFVNHLVRKIVQERGSSALIFHTNLYHAAIQAILVVAIAMNIYSWASLSEALGNMWQMQDVIIMLLFTEFGCKYSLICKASMCDTLEFDLELAKEESVRAERKKATMLRYLHHELRNNLQRITYLSEQISTPPANEHERPILERSSSTLQSIQTCSAYITNVVQDVLTMETYESEELPIRERSYDLSVLIRSEFTHFEQFTEALGKHIFLENTLPDTYQVIGDSDRVRQILRIVGESCITHSSDTDVKVCASVNGSLNVQFAPASQDAMLLMEPYALIPESHRDDHFESTFSDLSYSVAHRLLKAIFGHILLDHDKHQTQIIIPVKCDTIITDRASSVVNACRHSLRMLIVDDALINRAILRKNLQKILGKNVHIQEAADGQEASDMVLKAHNIFDVIWMDMVMPRKDGLSACVEIKSVLPTTLVFMVSANDLSDQKPDVNGPDDTTLKPITRQNMEMLMKKYKII